MTFGNIKHTNLARVINQNVYEKATPIWIQLFVSQNASKGGTSKIGTCNKKLEQSLIQSKEIALFLPTSNVQVKQIACIISILTT